MTHNDIVVSFTYRPSPEGFSGMVSNPAQPNDVAGVGCVIASENNLLGFLCRLFGVGYTACTSYIVTRLDLHYSLNTMPLRPNRGTRLADIYRLVQFFLKQRYTAVCEDTTIILNVIR